LSELLAHEAAGIKTSLGIQPSSSAARASREFPRALLCTRVLARVYVYFRIQGIPWTRLDTLLKITSQEFAATMSAERPALAITEMENNKTHTCMRAREGEELQRKITQASCGEIGAILTRLVLADLQLRLKKTLPRIQRTP